MTSTLVAADLDRTLIYSRGTIEAYGRGRDPLVPVERYEGRDVSWMTTCAAATFADLHHDAVVVPTTTRTPEQWTRISLPGPPPRYAVTANGGVLLVDGEIDPCWDLRVAVELARGAPLEEIWQHAARVCRPEWTAALRNARGLFCYAVLNRTRIPAGFLAESAAWASDRGWQLSLQGRKLYWVPASLTKSAAVAEIAKRTGCVRTLAAGDSLLDRDLVEAADAGIMARHGELAESGWHTPHVTTTEGCGIRAGAEIVEWLAERCVQRSQPPGSSPPGTASLS